MGNYFKDLWSGISTVLIGMKVTFVHLFQPNITIQYPKVKKEMYPRTRARLVNYMPECGFCQSCARVCPIGIIEMKGVRGEPEDNMGFFKDGKPRKIHMVEFKIDFAKCLYCGLCVDACDTESLHWEAPQEATMDNREALLIDFSTYTPEEIARLYAREEEKKKAKAAATATAGTAPATPKPVAPKPPAEPPAEATPPAPPEIIPPKPEPANGESA